MVQNGVQTFIPVFTGYVFARCTDDRIAELAKHHPQGLSCILPYKISEDQIERMRKEKEQFAKTTPPKARRKLAGERVVITNGPFKDFQGEVIQEAQEKAHVRILIFGRPTPVIIDIADIQLAQ